MNELAIHTSTPLQMFLTLYVGLGTLWLLGMLTYEHFVNGPDAIIRGLDRKEAPSWPAKVWQSMRLAVGYTLIASLTVLLWPVFTLAMAGSCISKRLPRKAVSSPEEKLFKVERSHLQTPMMVEEIELREMVSDPLGGAPGHRLVI